MKQHLLLRIRYAQIGHLLTCLFLLLSVQDLRGQAIEVADSAQNGASTFVFPEAVGYVNDFSGLLSDSLEAELAHALIEYEAGTSREIAIVLVDDLGPYTDIVKYGTDLANNWGIGKKELNNGVLIVLCFPLRKVGISVGLGAEKVLTNSVCQAIIDELMMPKFRQQEYFFGLRAGINTIMGVWDE
ncbi:MAG: TPM domain-containing protein [Flavobacteriales bacterium]|nr:TPM domain-containing protein [Flavobacteriales bacterium]